MTVAPVVLARGPWRPADVEVSWRQEPFALSPEVTGEIDRALARLRSRGSPGHDGPSVARLAGFDVDDGRLRLVCEPVRWALRLLPDARQSLLAVCVVRSADGQWLAGRRAGWLATRAGCWELGASGSVTVPENPVDALARELAEEWSVRPARLTIEALVRQPGGLVWLVGVVWLAKGATVTPDDEHDDYGWWPADVADWPPHADAAMRRLAELITPPD